MSKASCWACSLFTLILCSINSWALPANIQAAKDEGMRLYNIGHSTDAMPYLRQAAEADDAEAMYYMGESERRQNMLGMTAEAMEWYLKAAEQDDPYSMLHLFRGGACIAGDRCPEDSEGWREQALKITLPKAEEGDPEAMLAMYYIYSNLDSPRLTWLYHVLGIPTRASQWLKRAAEAGLAEAQTIWGQHIMGGQGWYFTESRRLEAAESWFRRAAEEEYIPAMEQMARVNREAGDFDESWQWMQRSSQYGNYDSRLGVGWCYLEPERDENCQNSLNKIEGWAILFALSKEIEDGSSKKVMDWHYDELTVAERQQAEELAEEEWIGRQPPISKFPRRFGY